VGADIGGGGDIGGIGGPERPCVNQLQNEENDPTGVLVEIGDT
jgi:hypothetical protein